MSGFTVNQLIKRLEKLRDAGHGRKRVHVDTWSYENNLDANIMPVCGLGVSCVDMLDGDGAQALDSRGHEKTRNLVVLVGWGRSDSEGNISKEHPDAQ